MNITPINQNNGFQSFGMAFKVNANGAKKLAENFHSYSDPMIAEKYFMQDIGEPLKKLKSKVTYDGERVFVENESGTKLYEVLDNNRNCMEPFSPAESDYRRIGFHVKEKGSDAVSVYNIDYSEPQNKISGLSNTLALTSDDQLKLLCAKEIATDLDRIAAKQSQETYANNLKEKAINETANRLSEIFG